MKLSIAVIGWGSLIWDPRGLKITESGWRPDGPLLPIEYLRASGLQDPPKRLTLVLVDRGVHTWATRDVRTLWAASVYDALDDARANLAVREGSKVSLVGYVVSARVPTAPTPRLSLTAIRTAGPAATVGAELETWLDEMELDAAIWADLPASDDLDGLRPSEDAALAFLGRLQGADRASAEAYIRRTPLQVRTPIRERVERDLVWTPQLVPTPIRSSEDLRFADWTEARAAIGRFDTILVDVRKVGFSLATGLLAATTLLGFLGVPVPATPSPSAAASTDAPASTWPIEARAAVWLALISLVVLLFLVDMYFEVLLSGAVERALDLEVQTDPPVRITKYMSTNIHRVWGAKLVFYMYVGLLLLVSGFAVLMVSFATEAERAKAWWVVPVAIAAVIFVWNYGKIGQRRTHQETLKERLWPEGSEKVGTPDVSSWRTRP